MYNIVYAKLHKFETCTGDCTYVHILKVFRCSLYSTVTTTHTYKRHIQGQKKCPRAVLRHAVDVMNPYCVHNYPISFFSRCNAMFQIHTFVQLM